MLDIYYFINIFKVKQWLALLSSFYNFLPILLIFVFVSVIYLLPLSSKATIFCSTWNFGLSLSSWLKVKSCQLRAQLEGNSPADSVLFCILAPAGAWVVYNTSVSLTSMLTSTHLSGFNGKFYTCSIWLLSSELSSTHSLYTKWLHLTLYTSDFSTIQKHPYASSFLESFTETPWSALANGTLGANSGQENSQTSLPSRDGSNHTLSNQTWAAVLWRDPFSKIVLSLSSLPQPQNILIVLFLFTEKNEFLVSS